MNLYSKVTIFSFLLASFVFIPFISTHIYNFFEGKDLTIQKLKLEIALRDKIIDKQSDMLADLGYTDCSRWTSGSSNKPSMSSKAESSPLNSSSGRGVVAESCDIKFPLRCGSSKQTHSDLGAPSSTEDSESDPPNLLLPFRASPRTSRTPSKLGSRCAGLPLYEESDRRRCASKGEESRSLLTLSVQKLTPNNTEKSDLNGGDALENAVYISKFSPVISADPREEGVLDSRLRRELEQGDWSEVPQPSPSFILQASESMTHIAKSNTGMNFVEASMDAHKQREKKKVRKGLMSTFSVPIEIQGESVATTDIPRRPVGRKPRNDIDSSNLLNGTVVGDQRDSGFEVEPSMIQIHSFIGYVHPKKVVEGTQMLSATERVEDLDEVEGKKSKAVRGIQKTSNSSAMQPLLPKKSPRGRPLGQGGAFTAFSSQDTPDPLLSRGVQMPISKGFNKIS